MNGRVGLFPRDKECLEIHKYLSAGTLNPGNCNELTHEGTQDVEHTHALGSLAGGY